MAEKTILCVDDEEYILKSLYRVFTRASYRVLSASSGKEALEILAKEKDVQLVIADQRMPGMTGDELVKEIRQRYPHIIRIILSAYMDFNALATAINEGEIYRFISKPWEEKELLEIVAQGFERREALGHLHELISGITTMLEETEDVTVETLQESGILSIKAIKKDGSKVSYEKLSHFLRLILEALAEKKLHPYEFKVAGGIITRRGGKLTLEIEIGKGIMLALEFPMGE